MENPFVFGKIAKGKAFTDRKAETEQLINNFSSLIHTILISPRRWGKSSLVAKAAESAMQKDSSLRFVFIDLYNIRTEEEFYPMLAQKVLQATSSKIEGIAESIKKFIGNLVPRLSYSPGAVEDFSLSFDWQELKKQPDEILDLAERIAQDKNLKIVVCIDEFQNISGFENPLAIQQKMRAHWQKHQKTAYCLYGSKRHMLIETFASPSMPFFKFGNIMFLQKIEAKDWEIFIQERFEETKKKIKPEIALKIAQHANYHPHYVQQLAQLCWFRTKTECKPETVEKSLENLIMQLSLLFQTITDGLSNTQVNFLKALLNEATKLSSQETINKYKLGTSANVSRIKQALLEKEIIDLQNHEISFSDPIYQYWLKKHYFKMQA